MSRISQDIRGDEYDTYSVFVVEDSADHMELIRRSFAASPYNVTVTCCASLKEAREQLQVLKPDVILADMRLPDGDGVELLDEAGTEIPLVLMTSYGDVSQAMQAIKGGACDYITKNDENFASMPEVCRISVKDWRADQERIATQKALAASEARYRILFENLPAGIFQCNPAGKITVANPALARILGYANASQLKGLSLFGDIVETKTAAADIGAELRACARRDNFEVKLNKADSGRAVGMMNIEAVTEKDCVCCYEGFYFDLTSQHLADAALAETGLRLEAALKNTFGFIALVDCEGCLLDINESALQATGCALEEVKSVKFWDAPWWKHIEGESELVRAGIAAACAGQRTRDQCQFESADGQPHVADRSFTPVFDQNRELRFIVVEGRDITELVATSRKLEESEQQFRNLFESASEAIVVLDVERGYLIDVNSNAESLFEAPKAKLLSMSLSELSPAIQPDRRLSADVLLNHIQAAIAGSTEIFDWMHQSLGGKQVPCEVRLIRLPDEGRILLRGSITDISARKAAETGLREQQQRLSALIENATSGIIEIDADGGVMSANPAAVAMLNHNQLSELLGSQYLGHVRQHDRGAVAKALDDAWLGRNSSLVYTIADTRRERIVASSFIAIRGKDAAVARVMLMSDDITRRFADQQELKEEKRFADAVINSLPGTFYVYTEDGQLVRFNDRFLELNGYSEEEALQMGPADFFDNEGKQRIEQGLQAVFESGEASTEANLIRKDGQVVPMLLNACLLEQHSRRFVVGVGLDMTARKRSEARFLSEKKFSETIINAMPGVFYVIDQDRHFVRWNDNLANLTGLSHQQLGKIDPRQLIAEEDREAMRQQFERVFEEGEGRVEAGLVTSKGEIIPHVFTGLRLATSTQSYMVGMGFDISERRRYEAQLLASQNYLRSVIESEPECVWTLDRDGRLLNINPAGRLLLGEATVEFLRKNSVVRLVVNEHRKAFMQLAESVFSGHSGILTFEIETLDGVRRWLETHAVALRNEKEEISGHLAVTRDITAQRDADRKIREYSRRLQKLSQRLLETQEIEKRHLARELHDEVGQSLTALKLDLQGNASLPGQSAASLLDSMQIVDNVLQQVRDISLDLRPAILDDLGLLPALRWYVDRQSSRTHVIASLSADSLTGVRLPTDVETAAFRIVQEALTNVARHSQAERVDVSVSLDGERLQIDIRDDGCGFDSAAGLQRAARGGSFGLLGLQERAVLLGGQTDIDSTPGEGTRIRAWLPLTLAEEGPRIARTG